MKFLAFFMKCLRKYQLSKTAKSLGGKRANESNILCKILSFKNNTARRVSSTLGSKFQRKICLLMDGPEDNTFRKAKGTR